MIRPTTARWRCDRLVDHFGHTPHAGFKKPVRCESEQQCSSRVPLGVWWTLFKVLQPLRHWKHNAPLLKSSSTYCVCVLCEIYQRYLFLFLPFSPCHLQHFDQIKERKVDDVEWWLVNPSERFGDHIPILIVAVLFFLLEPRWTTAIIHLADYPSLNWTRVRRRPVRRWAFRVPRPVRPTTAAASMATTIQRIAPSRLASTRPSPRRLLVRQKASATTTTTPPTTPPTRLRGPTTAIPTTTVAKVCGGSATIAACGASDHPTGGVPVPTTGITPPPPPLRPLAANCTCPIRAITRRWARCWSRLSSGKIKSSCATCWPRVPPTSTFWDKKAIRHCTDPAGKAIWTQSNYS